MDEINGLSSVNKYYTYLETIKKLKARYTKQGSLFISTGGIDSKYTKLEKMCFDKYLK